MKAIEKFELAGVQWGNKDNEAIALVIKKVLNQEKDAGGEAGCGDHVQ